MKPKQLEDVSNMYFNYSGQPLHKVTGSSIVTLLPLIKSNRCSMLKATDRPDQDAGPKPEPVGSN